MFPTATPRRPHRRLFWAAVVVAVLTIAVGGALAASGSTAQADPATVVRDYFAALARSDAPAALALGPVPRGSHALLTSAALRAQQQPAPIRDVTVGPTATTAVTPRGATAVIQVGYHLAFAAGDVAVSSKVRLRRTGGTWQLDRSALTATLTLSSSSERATLLGAAVPVRPVPIFPGAVPIDFDSPYLDVSPATDGVAFGAAGADLEVGVTTAGRRAAGAAVLSALRDCLTGQFGSASSTCPEPDGRVIPGSLRGRITGAPRRADVSLRLTPVGQLEVHASVSTQVTYQRLDFRNRVRTHSGREVIALHALAYGVAPLRIRWVR